MIRFSWDITYVCNYRCPYCWWDPYWEGLAKSYPSYPSAEEWINAWDRVGDLYGSVEIEILGGEPLVFPQIEKLVSALTRKHFLNITTNLSVSEEALESLLAMIEKDHLRLAASYHPQFSGFDAFFEKVRFLWKNELKVPVLLVAYPPNLRQLFDVEKTVRAAGIPTTVWVFTGRYAGKSYPESYTLEELDILRSMIPEGRAAYNLERVPTLGKLCHTGHLYANVKPNGDVYRCGQSADTKISMGNLFQGNFRLWDGPTPCPMKRCICSEYAYLVEEWDKNHEEVAFAKEG